MTLVWVGLAVLAVLLGLLALPVRLSVNLSLQVPRDWNAEIRFRILAPLLPWIRVKPGTRKALPDAPRGTGWRPSTAQRHRMLRAVPQLVAKLLSCVHIDRLLLDIVFGTGDPATTGETFGALAPFLYGTPRPAGWNAAVRPDFDNARLEGSAACELRLRPLALAGPLLGFVWSVFGAGR
ncbi:DUF2953 domain-containing protein [Sagittula salina]|uniref:DUF2953 domain-containing protein n=1 Tax=Sagittula salina TaxID=2820268 RepID=A0A940MPM4_9RHOB|nr:DUF2953 domain-containing protein [Sagittula salina]MBP0482617.1 DUF2953 domain-containing protein [Sagittula salina]